MDKYPIDRALADVVFEAVKSERYTAVAMQGLAGIKPRTWSNYFTSHKSPVPVSVVWTIGQIIGIPGSELMRRAEDRAQAVSSDPLTDHLSDGQRRRLDDLRDPFVAPTSSDPPAEDEDRATG